MFAVGEAVNQLGRRQDMCRTTLIQGHDEVSTGVSAGAASELCEVLTHSLSAVAHLQGPSLELDGIAVLALRTPSRCPTPVPLSPMLLLISSTAHMTSPVDALGE